jgi:hypothetical protein
MGPSGGSRLLQGRPETSQAGLLDLEGHGFLRRWAVASTGSGFLEGRAEALEVRPGDLWGSTGLAINLDGDGLIVGRFGLHLFGWAKPSTGGSCPWGLQRVLLGLFPVFRGDIVLS